MTKRKLAIPILLMLSLSILGQTLVPFSAGYVSPAIYIDANGSDSIIDEAGVLTIITMNVTTDYEGSDIWGYQFTLTYNPLILNGFCVTNGDVITANVTYVAGTFNNTIGRLSLTLAFSSNATGDPAGNTNTGTGTLATVVFNVTGSGETPIKLEDVTAKLKGVDGSSIIDGYLHPEQLGHGYFRNEELPIIHDVAATGMVFHHDIPATTTYSTTPELIYVDTTIENQGEVPEMFDVSTYYVIYGYPSLVDSETVAVANGTTTVVSHGLNTTGFPYGFLTVKVEVSEVYGETQTNDNTYNTTLLIKFTGDIVGDPTDPDPNYPDGDVDWFDFGEFAGAFGKNYPHALYDVECDFDRNGNIDWFDFGDFAANYGKSVPAYEPL
jgi:hypothetical protein